jgi:hypothetical protein
MNSDKYKHATCISHMQTEFCGMTDFVTAGAGIPVLRRALYDTGWATRAIPRKPAARRGLFVTESPGFVIS